ncbi:MAG TPA: hypothetical protein VKC65_00815 [Gaiellaceae bacterium]|nr:hypothetical protein [Gaiellaceae bacterium]
MKRMLVRAVAVGALAAALGLALAACGGSGDSNGVASLSSTGQTTTSSSSGSGGASPRERREAELKFARCMREHGVDIPDPVNGRFDLKLKPGDQKNAEAAQRACAKYLQSVAPRISPEEQTKMRQAALDYAKCMRDHGIEMADPQFQEGGGMTMRMPEHTREDDPKFKDAQKACEPILRAARPAGEKPMRESRS